MSALWLFFAAARVKASTEATTPALTSVAPMTLAPSPGWTWIVTVPVPVPVQSATLVGLKVW